MNKLFGLTTAGILLCSAAAMAQTTPNTTSNTVAPSATGQPAMNGVPMRQKMVQSLEHSGFTDVKVVPDSFFVSAKDQSGNPISMLVSPNSVTEMIDATSGHGPGAQAANNTGGANAGQNGAKFATNVKQDVLASKLNGLMVQSANGQGTIGTLHDVAMHNGQLQAYIVDLNNGQTVAVLPSAMTVSQQQGGALTAKLDVTQAQLQSAPSVTLNQG